MDPAKCAKSRKPNNHLTDEQITPRETSKILNNEFKDRIIKNAQTKWPEYTWTKKISTEAILF